MAPSANVDRFISLSLSCEASPRRRIGPVVAKFGVSKLLLCNRHALRRWWLPPRERRPADPVVIRTSFFLMDQDLALMVHFAER